MINHFILFLLLLLFVCGGCCDIVVEAEKGGKNKNNNQQLFAQFEEKICCGFGSVPCFLFDMTNKQKRLETQKEIAWQRYAFFSVISIHVHSMLLLFFFFFFFVYLDQAIE